MAGKRSGIDMLEELLDRLKTLEKRLDVIDTNIKIITNGTNLAKLIDKAVDTPLKEHAKAMVQEKPKAQAVEPPEKGFKNFNFEPTDAAKLKKKPAPKRAGAKTNTLMVKGKLKIGRDGKNVPLSGVSVKIYDEKDKMVKQTKTNRAGHWMSKLPPGKYVALFEGEINGQKLLPQNRNFEVPTELPKGKKEIEVI